MRVRTGVEVVQEWTARLKQDNLSIKLVIMKENIRLTDLFIPIITARGNND
jgi:hypothetical protein